MCLVFFSKRELNNGQEIHFEITCTKKKCIFIGLTDGNIVQFFKESRLRELCLLIQNFVLYFFPSNQSKFYRSILPIN